MVGDASTSSSSSSAVVTGTSTAVTRRRRTDVPAGSASSIVPVRPRAASGSSASSWPWSGPRRKAAKYPDRGGSPGTKVNSAPASAGRPAASSGATIVVPVPSTGLTVLRRWSCRDLTPSRSLRSRACAGAHRPTRRSHRRVLSRALARGATDGRERLTTTGPRSRRQSSWEVVVRISLVGDIDQVPTEGLYRL